MITIITGSKRSGKTSKALELASNKESVYLHISAVYSRFAYSLVDESTEVIIIDEVASFDQVKNLIASTHIWIEKRGEKGRQIPKPWLIICTHETDWPIIRDDVKFINL